MIEALEREALRAWAGDLAAAPARWEPRVRHRADERIFLRLDAPEGTEGWLICWMPGQDTGFHDHDLSSGAVTVVGGAVYEERLGLGQNDANVYVAGDTFDFTASEIHRVTHWGDEAAVTLHAYSPRLRRLGAYAISPGGALKRHPLGYGEELRPVATAGTREDRRATV